MSDYFYDEDRPYEPEPEIDLPDKTAELTTKLSINAGQLEAAIDAHLNSILEQRVKRIVDEKIKKHMDRMLSKDAWGSGNFESILYKAIVAKLNEKYPDVVENKVNEFYEAILKAKYTDGRRGDDLSSIQEKAKKKVDEYIEKELKESVQLSKEYIEQFSKNYFAQNLFRAMGMMDKMIPQTENIQKELK